MFLKGSENVMDYLKNYLLWGLSWKMLLSTRLLCFGGALSLLG